MTTALESLITMNADHPILAQSQGGGMAQTLVMMAMIFGIFYFLLIRPQQKEHKAHMALLMGLQKGDKVATASGLHGRVYEVGGETVVLEVSDRVRLTVDKSAVKRKTDAEESSTAKVA